VLVDQHVELAEAPRAGERAPALGEGAPVGAVLLAQRAVRPGEQPALAGDPGVDLRHALHPPRALAALQVGLDRALRLAGPPGERPAEPGGLVEVAADDPLDVRSLILVEHRLVIARP
jgi:hypothetical protein